MPRYPTPNQSMFPYHVGARSINRDWFELPLEQVWDIMSEQLFFIHYAFNVRIHSFVLMNNHFHLLISTPEANLSEAMAWFMRETSRSLTKSGNRINQSYGGRFFRSVLETHHYYLHAYKYVYANPLNANIVSRAEDYPYSSLAGLLGSRKLAFPVEHDTTLFSDLAGTIEWINTPSRVDHLEAVRRALYRKQFKLRKIRGKDHFLESNLL